MFSEIFQSVNGINYYGLISTVIFFVFFAAVALHAFSMKNEELSDFSRMPFEDDTKDSNDV
ncbi:MAG: cbb3-type cytochrome c oxidase subunit 3 [Bacteroidota bacterium]|jgi:cbb3-type cytochrome oxidase subunit 3